MTRLRQGQVGLTLVEVMVALLIAALALSALSTRLGKDTDTSFRLKQTTFAMIIATNHIAELRLANAFPDTGRSNEDIDFAGREWLLTTVVEDTEIEGLRRAVVAVADKVRPDDPIRTVVGFLSNQQPPAVTAIPSYAGLQTTQGVGN